MAPSGASVAEVVVGRVEVGAWRWGRGKPFGARVVWHRGGSCKYVSAKRVFATVGVQVNTVTARVEAVMATAGMEAEGMGCQAAGPAIGDGEGVLMVAQSR